MVLLSFFYVSFVILGPLSAILYHTFQYKCNFFENYYLYSPAFDFYSVKLLQKHLRVCVPVNCRGVKTLVIFETDKRYKPVIALNFSNRR